MPWITGNKRTGFRTQWRLAGRGSANLTGPTRDGKAEAAGDLAEIEDLIARARQRCGMKLSADDVLSLGNAWTSSRRKQARDREPINEIWERWLIAKAAPVGGDSITLLLERWRESVLAMGEARKARADLVVATLTAMAKAMGWKTSADITVASVERWVVRKARLDAEALAAKAGKAEAAPGKARGVHKPIKMVKQFVAYARRSRQPVDLDVLDMKLPPITKRPGRPKLTDQQVATVLATAYTVGGFSVGVAVEHLAMYPCRPIDVCRVDVRDWNAPGRRITYRDSKNKDDLQHLVDEQHAAKLDQLAAGRGPDEPLFLDPWGRRWLISKHGSASGLNSWYKQHLGEHLLPAGQQGIYRLKKWAMPRVVVAAKGDLAVAAALSGHRDMEVVAGYLDENDDAQGVVLAALPPLPTLAPAAVIAGPGSASTAASTDRISLQTTAPAYRRKYRPRLKNAVQCSPLQPMSPPSEGDALSS